MKTLQGHFSVFGVPYEIDNPVEGNFLETVAPGAFAKTFREQRSQIRVLYGHGYDPSIGDKPLGVISDLREDRHGAFYRVELLRQDDGEYVDYVRGLVPGLEAGLYGSSFRFRSVRETFDPKPGRSTANPRGIPERRLEEVRVFEFGPTTFGAAPAATASVRSSELRDLPRTDSRLEVVGRAVSPAKHKGETHVTRRLRDRASDSAAAAQLLRAVERGEAVTITWGALDPGVRTVAATPLWQGPSRTGRKWRLPTAPTSTHRLPSGETPAWLL